MKRLSKNNALKFTKYVFSAENIKKIDYINTVYAKRFKVVVFVPENKAEELAFAMSKAGAGKIGNYTVCSFRAKGTGTFRGGKNTNPVIGRKGRFEKADEVRLEMVCDIQDLDNVVSAILKTHPYEEPAYDIYKILSGKISRDGEILFVSFKKPVEIREVIEKINDRIDTGILTESIKPQKFKKAVINFSGFTFHPSVHNPEGDRLLVITKNINDNFNIRLN
jgi:hypothetical protein